MGFISVAILLAAYQFMAFMARSNVSNGVVLDSGTDLNLQGGIAEWVFPSSPFPSHRIN